LDLVLDVETLLDHPRLGNDAESPKNWMYNRFIIFVPRFSMGAGDNFVQYSKILVRKDPMSIREAHFFLRKSGIFTSISRIMPPSINCWQSEDRQPRSGKPDIFSSYDRI
jgi:hypothetical protein